MQRVSTLIPAAAAALLAGCATAAPTAQASNETVIPFVSSIRSVEWKAASDEAAYVRGGKGEWYLVRTANRCTRLLSSTGLGFETSAANQLDRFGALLVEGQRCPVASITRSEPPPRKSRRRASAA
jgi:hypothetical protein